MQATQEMADDIAGICHNTLHMLHETLRCLHTLRALLKTGNRALEEEENAKI